MLNNIICTILWFVMRLEIFWTLPINDSMNYKGEEQVYVNMQATWNSNTTRHKDDEESKNHLARKQSWAKPQSSDALSIMAQELVCVCSGSVCLLIEE